jgi:hypothetical protein
MSLDGEVLSDWTEARQERLRALRNPEAAHPALAFTRGLVAVFSMVIDPGTGFDEHMLDVRQLGDLRLRGWVAAQLVGDDLARHFRTSRQCALKKPLGCSLVATLLQQDIEFGAVLIGGSPQ